jgi:WhiB family redox-sensing transcriptional regulator
MSGQRTEQSAARNEGHHAANVALINIWRSGAVEEGYSLEIRRRRIASERALNELLRRNAGLVWREIERVRGERERREDLYSVGMLGLLKGIERYDASFGCTLATYASWWIKQAIGRELQKEWRSTRLESLEPLGWEGEAAGNIADTGETVEEAAGAAVLGEELERCIKTLEAEERAVLAAWIRNDGNLPAAARETAIEQTTARQRLYAAWSKLQHPTNRHSLLAVEWESAACRGEPQAAYFPGRGRGKRAVACAACPVQTACLEAGLADQRLLGIWGGIGERERKQMRRAVE